MPNKDAKRTHAPMPINGTTSGLQHPKKFDAGKVWAWTSGIIASVIILGFVGVLVWYNVSLAPLGSDIGQLKKVTISPGSTSAQISKELQKQSIIRSATAFDIYVRLSGKNNVLKAGTYRLSPAESTQKIVEHFVNGSVDKFSITFYPGATLVDNTDRAKSKKYDVTTVLEKAGFTSSEISEGLNKKYDGTSYKGLFAGKPLTADLEGYIYGETYNFNVGATVSDIFETIFAEFYETVKKYDLVNKYSSHGLNLYQGITLASIIQREANGPDDQKQVAQVFYSRISIDMMLGSDVTYQYVADKTGVARDPGLDSPYNTRRYTGLPPGPIAVPGLTALQAVATPADGDYLFFLSGDDDITYFAKTNAEHEANITDHCKIKCSTP